MMQKIKTTIPSILTLANFIAGFAAILINQPFYGLILVLTGCFFDIFDGIVARALHVSSEFGKQIDSLSDIVSFGIAPAYLLYQHVLPHTPLSLIIVSLLPVFSAIRLAHFNTDLSQRYSFKGLPTPANGIFFASLPYINILYNNLFSTQIILSYIIIILFSLLMILPIRMFSFKRITEKGLNSIISIFFILIMIILFCWIKWLAIPAGVIIYIVLSLFYAIFYKSTIN